MPSSIISPFPVFNDLDGSPLENGYIYIGQSNLNPETAPVNVFWDAARTIPAAQPIRTIGGFPSRNGSPSNVYVEADTYSITVRNSRRVFVYSAFDQSDAPSSVFDISTQVITATAGQTTFTLTTFTYLPGTDTLQVYRNGLRLTSVTDYIETNSSTVTLTNPAAVGDEFLFQGGAVITGNQTPGTAVSFIQAGTGAVTRTMQDKVREVFSVKDFGAVGNGTTDDTAAFSAAAKAAIGTICLSNAWDVSYPLRVIVDVPAGSYLLSSLIDTGGHEVVWHCDHGAEFLPLPQTGLSRLNGRLVRDGIHYSSYQFGIKDPATTLSIKGNPLEWHDEGAYVNAFTYPYQLADVAARDACTLVVDNRNMSATADVASANYSATTFLPASPLSADTLKKLRIGMVIDTKHTPTKYSGFITGWASNGTSVTVSGWFATGNQASGQVPSNGTGAWINIMTKIFAQNSLVWLDADPSNTGKAKEAAGFELDIHNNKGTPGGADVDYAWGFDCVSAGTYPATAAYLSRGRFNVAYHALGSAGSGPYIGDQTIGFRYDGNQTGMLFVNRTTRTGVALQVNDVALGTTAVLYADGNLKCPNTARAWVNFDGNLSSFIAPRSQFNIEYVQKTATGKYKIGFLVPMLNDRFCTFGSFNDVGAGATTFATTAWTTTDVSIALTRPGVGYYDHGVVNVVVFNDSY